MSKKITVIALLGCSLVVTLAVFGLVSQGPGSDTEPQSVKKSGNTENLPKPTMKIPEKEEEADNNDEKNRRWTAEEASFHNAALSRKLKLSPPRPVPADSTKEPGDQESFANDTLFGTWKNRGPRNMPGAWQFAEMIDGTDIIYGVTCGHYGGTQFIYKGTLAGDDFHLISGNFPNRFQDLMVIPNGSDYRIIAGIDHGQVAYSDNDGFTWQYAEGLPPIIHSTVVNRQDDYRIYATDGQDVYLSTDNGSQFVLLEEFATTKESRLYTPRYAIQSGSQNVYLAREGEFFQLNSSKTSFDAVGGFAWPGDSSQFSIGGDSQKLYVTSGSAYFVSDNGGSSWVPKTPQGSWYGESTDMSPGQHLAVHPENSNIVIAGYAHPVLSTDGLDTTVVDGEDNWWFYQINGSDPEDRHRKWIHPDIQGSHFFYDANNDLVSIRCSDGGVFRSYKEWTDPPVGNYAPDTYYNITLYGTPSQEAYPAGIMTGKEDPNHIVVGTQDQGNQTSMNAEDGALDFLQGPYGDGNHLITADGENGWSFNYIATEVYPPFKLYSASAGFLGAHYLNHDVLETFDGGWYFHNAVVDENAPGERLWILSKALQRVEWNGADLTGTTTNFGGNSYVAALAQSLSTDKVWALENGTVYVSSDNGDTWNSGTPTPLGLTNNQWDRGGGWNSPVEQDLLLFTSPSSNDVVSVISHDGGSTWNDVSGIFPNTETNCMKGTPDGKFVFASTKLGPYVFSVEFEQWFDLSGGDAPAFYGQHCEYIQSTNTMRFSTWGLGIWDFSFEEGSGPDGGTDSDTDDEVDSGPADEVDSGAGSGVSDDGCGCTNAGANAPIPVQLLHLIF